MIEILINDDNVHYRVTFFSFHHLFLLLLTYHFDVIFAFGKVMYMYFFFQEKETNGEEISQEAINNWKKVLQ